MSELFPSTVNILLGLGGVTSAFLLWATIDYYKYLALGPGGPPYSLRGWAMITFTVRPYALRAKDSTWTSDYPSIGAHHEILSLPERHGARAELGGIAPHRQLSQRAPETMRMPTKNLFRDIVPKNPDLLESKLSLYERHDQALFVHSSLVKDAKSAIPDTARISRGEIGHVHNDTSCHLYLAPADARIVIEKGWAERHRLARTTPFLGKMNLYNIGGTYLMIYGPRNEDELLVLKTILRNSVRFMTGCESVRS